MPDNITADSATADSGTPGQIAETANTATDPSTADRVTETETGQHIELPEDHPLVKKLGIQKGEILDLKSKNARLIASSETEGAAVAEPAKVAEALRPYLAALHQFDDVDVELSLTANEPELLLKQAARLAELSGKRKNTNRVPNEGTKTSGEPASDMSEFARGLFGAPS